MRVTSVHYLQQTVNGDARDGAARISTVGGTWIMYAVVSSRVQATAPQTNLFLESLRLTGSRQTPAREP